MDASLAGIPADFAFNQQLHKVAPRTLGAELNFQVWLEDVAYQVLLRHRARLGEQEFQARCDRWHRDCAAGTYEWGGEPAWRRFQTDLGLEKMLWLKLSEGAAEHGGAAISEEEVHAIRTRRPEEWARLLGIMRRQDFPPPAEGEGADPNAGGGAAAP